MSVESSQIEGTRSYGWLTSQRTAAGAIFVAVTCLAAARLLVTGNAFNHVWAEDGKVYLAAAQQHGVASLFYRYAGYLQVPSRAVALIGEALPLRDYATYVVIASSLVVGGLAAFVYVTAAKVLHSTVAAVVAALGMALAPALATASLGTLANLQWFLIYAAFWAMLVPASDSRPYSATIVAALAALTSPLAVFVAPVAVVVHGPRKALRYWPLLALIAGEALQLIAIALLPETGGGPVRKGITSSTVKTGLENLFKSVLGPTSGPYIVRVFVGLVIAVLLLWAWWAAKRRLLGTAAVITGLAIYCVTTAVTGYAASRYVGITTMFMIGGLACFLPQMDRRGVLAALTVLAVLFIVSFPASSSRLSGPTWSGAVSQHEAECRRPRVAATEVPLSPPGWSVLLSCS